MTIAACYLSPEGVVLGADSTSTYLIDTGSGPTSHFYNHAQKLFEVGDGSCLGILTWGLGGLGRLSYRTLVAQLADGLRTPSTDVGTAVDRWIGLFGRAYGETFAQVVERAKQTRERHEIVAARIATYQPDAPFPQELSDEVRQLTNEVRVLLQYRVGFCLAGCSGETRKPEAFEMEFSPLNLAPTALPVTANILEYWGLPNLLRRVNYGIDPDLVATIAGSTKWTGTDQELLDLVKEFTIEPPGALPLRDAIDYVHAGIYTTIKAMKFSKQEQACGGPIEIAVITTDRKFRWVRHKNLDEAIRSQEA